MSDLFRSLTSVTRALDAQRFALDATGHNIANVNTPGYSRRVVDFTAVAPAHPRTAGGGVDVAGIRAQRDRHVEARLYQDTSWAERHAAIADALGLVEVTLGGAGHGVDTRLNELFGSLSRLADAPTSMVARQEVLLRGAAVATAFNDTAAQLEALARDADRQVGATVGTINDLARRIATLNGTLGQPLNSVHTLHTQDAIASLVRELAALTDVAVIARADGGVDLEMAGGRALVVGQHAYEVEAAPAPPNGWRTVTLGGADITGQVAGGRLGGLLEVRDTLIPGYQLALDEQAVALADAFNGIHAAAYDLDGNTGQAFFAFRTPPNGAAGAAAALMVDAAVAANANRIAAAEAAEPGDNRAARALAQLRDAPLLDGGRATLNEAWGQLVYRIGRDARSAGDETALRRQIVAQVESLRDQISGVSLDEEAMLLMKFQRAYEANARFFQVIDQALVTLINLAGR